jgi:DNA-binding response OmpR family regulator
MIKTILIADGSPTIRKIVELTFSKSRIRVEAASTGQEALDKIESTAPDLILAAVTLENPEAFELCRKVKSSPRPVPVLLLNSSFDPFDSDLAADCGADGHLPKPFETHELMTQVETLLENPHALMEQEPPLMDAPEEDEETTPLPAEPAGVSTEFPERSIQNEQQLLSPEQFGALTHAVAERLTEKVLRQVIHDIVPELATKLIRERLQELEAEDS